MLAALEATKKGMPVRRAATQYGIPRTTLQDRVRGKVVHGKNPGPKPYLVAAEEKELSQFLVDVAQAGYGKTRRQVMTIAENVAREKGSLKPDRRISRGWFEGFMKRQPQLSLRKGDATANVRMDCVNPEAMSQYFDLLNDVLEEHGLKTEPERIYNVDETGMPLDHRPPKIVTQRGHKKVRYRTAGNKSQITVIGCVSATGHAVPPFVIWDAKSMNKEWSVGEVPGTTYGLSSKGWVDSELFRGWMVDHFIPLAVAGRPLLLMLDGHSSHYQPDLVRFAKEHEIILFCLPPHTTHESQPLDTTVFGPLKQHWRNACHDFMQANPGRVITKYDFSALLNKAWMKTMTPANICSGFKKCGIYPYDRTAIKCGIAPQNLKSPDESSKTTESGIAFTEEEEKLYQTRYEEGYNLFDEKYVKWLEQNHPSNIPADFQHFTQSMPSTGGFEDLEPGGEPSVDSTSSKDASKASQQAHQTVTVTPGSTSSLPTTDQTDPGNVSSILDLFDDLSPEEPLLSEADPTSEPIKDTHVVTCDPQSDISQTTPETTQGVAAESPLLNSTPSNDSSSNSMSTSAVSNSNPNLVSNTSHSPPTNSATRPKDRQDPSSLLSSAPTTPSPSLSSSTSSSTTPASSNAGSSGFSSGSEPSPGRSGELRYISKYLVQYVATPKTTKPVAQRVSGARILTSSECEAILLEREAKKKKETEEKEKRKLEREKKKKEREDLQKQRAEQRAKKAEERAKLAEKKAEERRLRSKKRCAPKSIAPSTTKKSKVASKAPGDPATAGEPSASLTSSPEAELTAASSSKPSRQRKADNEGDGDGFDENQCCVCFRTYEEDVVEDTGLDWLQCACKRWLHEECIDYDIGHDADNNDLLCPFCCV
jgi:hypothetical protein